MKKWENDKLVDMTPEEEAEYNRLMEDAPPAPKSAEERIADLERLLYDKI